MRLLTVLALLPAALAQTPAFEVASVKPSEPITPAMVAAGRLQIGVTIDALNVRISKFSLFDLTRLAYQVKAYQISAPGWMVTERYDIQAKLPEGASRGQVPAMMQTLLAERFGLRLHRETRDLPVYALVPGKGGPRLKPAPPADPAAPAPPAGQLRAGVAVGPGGSAVSAGAGGGNDSRITPGAGGNLHIEFSRTTLASFADLLNRYSERPILDMTGIPGAFDMEIDVSGEEVRAAARANGVALPPPSDTPSDPAGVSMADSLAKLGLRLDPRKAPVEVLVIDKVEKIPTAN